MEQNQSSQTSESEKREPQPITLVPPRLASERLEYHAVSRGDFTTAGQELAEPLLLVGWHLSSPPLDFLLHRAKALELSLPPPNRFSAIPVGLALVRGEEGELDRRHRFLEPVEPVVVHLWEQEQQKTG